MDVKILQDTQVTKELKIYKDEIYEATESDDSIVIKIPCLVTLTTHKSKVGKFIEIIDDQWRQVL